MPIFEIAIILSMIAVNGLFAGYEIALASVSLARLQVLAQEKRAGARAALHMKENIEASLAVVQLGITLFGAIAAATGGVGAAERVAPFLQQRLGLTSGMADVCAIALIVVPLTVVTILFGELIPKVFALRNQEWLCLKLSPFMRGFGLVVRPAVVFFESSVQGIVGWIHRRWRPTAWVQAQGDHAELRELHAAAQLARTSLLIGRREEAIIRSAAGISRRPVREIMLPAGQINMLNVADSLPDCLIAAHLYLHTRFPVAEQPGNPQAIIGYVNFKDIIALMRLSPNEPSLRGILRPIPGLPASASVAASLEMMIRDHTHIALIRDEGKAVVGMITLEDVLEELVGEMHDEHDQLPIYVIRSGPGWVVGGGIPLSRLKEVTGFDLGGASRESGVRTVGDWIAGRLGRPVRGGDVVEDQGLRIVVRKIRQEKVQEAQLSPREPAPEARQRNMPGGGSPFEV
jgi:putative hemolysin